MRKLFHAIYLAGIVAEIAIRAPHERRRRQARMVVEHVDAQERGLLGLLFFGMLGLPLLYMVTPWLRWADFRWSERAGRRAGAIGVALMGAALWLFWRTHADLGRNWSPTLQLRDEHALVTHGVYRRIRHPMYASQWLWTLAQPLLLQNWLAGWAGVALFLPLYLVRLLREERMMEQRFGADYRTYMAHTGRVLPRQRQPRS